MGLLKVNGRQLARYTATAERLGIPLEEYLSYGNSGWRYCTSCCVWKRPINFLRYSYQKTHYTGICIRCRGFAPKPKQLPGKYWGPAIIAASRIGCSTSEYLEHKANNEAWCSHHKGWFKVDNKPRLSPPTRCKPCNQAYNEKRRSKKTSYDA